MSKLKAHLAADNERVLCGKLRTGGTETLVGPPRMQLKSVICARCWNKYDGPLAPNRKPAEFQTQSEKGGGDE